MAPRQDVAWLLLQGISGNPERHEMKVRKEYNEEIPIEKYEWKFQPVDDDATWDT